MALSSFHKRWQTWRQNHKGYLLKLKRLAVTMMLSKTLTKKDSGSLTMTFGHKSGSLISTCTWFLHQSRDHILETLNG